MNKKVWALIMATIIFLGCGIIYVEKSVFEVKEIKKKSEMTQWTCLFYFDGDNNLADYNQMLTNLEFLRKVGSTDEVKLIALLDRNGDGDTHLYYILKNNMTEISLSEVNETWKDEVNMGDPYTLISFIKWGIKNYPALHYNVMLSDHGGGWRGICWDDTSDEHLSLDDLKLTFREIKKFRGKNIEVLSTEACLVGMIEFVYSIKDVVDIFVGSETYGYGGENTTEGGLVIGNWQYDKVWGFLVENPHSTPEALATAMVTYFNEFGPWRAPPFIPKKECSDTISAINCSKIGRLAKRVNEVAEKLIERMRGFRGVWFRERIERCLMQTESFSGQLDWAGLGYYTNYDLYDFIYELSEERNIVDIEICLQVMGDVNDAVIAEHHGDNMLQGDHPDAHGISIYIPVRKDEYNEDYEKIDFAEDTSWDEFIKEFWWIR